MTKVYSALLYYFISYMYGTFNDVLKIFMMSQHAGVLISHSKLPRGRKGGREEGREGGREGKTDRQMEGRKDGRKERKRKETKRKMRDKTDTFRCDFRNIEK